MLEELRGGVRGKSVTFHVFKPCIQSAISRSLFSMESGNRSIHAPHCRLCCRYLLLLAACVSRQLTTKRYRKCQGICFVALQHNSDPRSSCDSVSRASARSRKAQSWLCATAGSGQGGAGHGKYLPTLRVQLLHAEQGAAVQSKPRWLSPPRTSRLCPYARRRVKLSTQTVASLDPLGRRTYHQQPRALHAHHSGWQTRTCSP